MDAHSALQAREGEWHRVSAEQFRAAEIGRARDPRVSRHSVQNLAIADSMAFHSALQDLYLALAWAAPARHWRTIPFGFFVLSPFAASTRSESYIDARNSKVQPAMQK